MFGRFKAVSDVSVKSSGRCAGVDIGAVLAYEAPFVIERLMKSGSVDSEEEGLALFDAVKRYMIIAETDTTVCWSMYSMRVDEAWHQFMLFTRAYATFCDRFFGHYFWHAPSNAPSPDGTMSASVAPEESSTFTQFQTRYEDLFGHRLPDVWFDERSITPWRRVLNEQAGTWTVCDRGEKISLVGAEDRLLLTMNGFAREALTFLAHTRVFYVRELPGDLTDAEKVALMTALVRAGLLQIAP
jgi:hypothetical protein